MFQLILERMNTLTLVLMYQNLEKAFMKKTINIKIRPLNKWKITHAWAGKFNIA